MHTLARLSAVACALPHIQEKNCTASLPSHSPEAELQAKRKGELNQALSTNDTKQPAVDSVMLQLCIQARRAQFEATSNKCRETFPKKLQNTQAGVGVSMDTIYEFGPFRLDISAEILFRGADPMPVGRRAVAVLRALLERPGIPVSKDALMQAGWPGLSVEEANLTVQIAALRRVFGDEPGADRWIETLPRHGYRFVGSVVAPNEAVPAGSS